MLVTRFLWQLRVPPAAAIINLTFRTPRLGKFGFSKIWIKMEVAKSQGLFTVPNSAYKIFALRDICRYCRRSFFSGSMLSVSSMVVYGVLRSIRLWLLTTHCEDGFLQFKTDPQTSSPALCSRENMHRIMVLIRKLLVPVFLLLTVWLNWGLNDPLLLATKAILTFITTKPFPSSVYMLVDQLQQRQTMNEQFVYYRFKSSRPKAVEIEDYMVLCVARIESKDRESCATWDFGWLVDLVIVIIQGSCFIL